MEESDEVDYDDSDSDFADLDVEDEEDVVAQPKKANQLLDDGPTLLRGDREEGEATPAASPKVTGASSELEDGEFLMDSEPMQLEEAASAHEAASKRQHDVEDCSSDGEGRHRRKRRHELSPETGSGRSDLHRSTDLKRGLDLDRSRGSRTSERARRSQGRESALKPQGSAYASVLDHGFRNAFHDLQPHVRNGSFPAFAPPPIRVDLHPLLHPPPSSAPSRGAPMRPAYAPPLEIRGAANLMVHDLRAGQASSQIFHLAYPLQAKHNQHQAPHAAIKPSGPMQLMLPRPMHGVPFGNHPPLDVRVPFGGPLRPGGVHPGGPRPPLKMADAVFLGPNLHRDRPLDNGAPFRQGSGQFNGRPGRKHDAIAPHEPKNHRGRSPTQGGSFPGVSRPPSDILRPGSGRVESVRSQLEGQGSGLGDPSWPRSDLPRQQRGILPLPPPPPDRHLERRMSGGRSPPEVEQRGDDVRSRASDQRPSFSPERKSPVKEQTGRGVNGDFERRDEGKAEGRSPRGSPGQEKAAQKRSRSPPVSIDRLREAKGSPSSGDKKTAAEDGSSVPVEVGKLSVEGRSPRGPGGSATREQRSSSTGGERDVSPSGTGRSPSKGALSESQGSQKAREGSQAAERKREEEARERELKERVMRARALQILEAGKHKKRKEREEETHSLDPGTSGRDVNRLGLRGLRRDGRDKNGQRVPRNWRRHSGFDEEDRERSSSRERQDDLERGSESLRNGLEAREQNGFAEVGSRRRRRGGGLGGPERTNANSLPLGEKTWPNVRETRDEGDGSLAQSNGRRVVVGLRAGERRPDLPRFSVRERDLDPDDHSARHSPGPPGFEGRAQRQGSRFGAEDGPANVRANGADQHRGFSSLDRSTALRRSGSGAVVGVRARQPSRTLVVNNLPLHYKMGHMTDIFKQYGPIQLIRQTGKSSAEVTFKREEDAKAARANVHRVVKLEGQELLVEY